MKIRIFSAFIISFITLITVNAQTGVKSLSPVGSWKFDAPYAPEGYNSGTIEVANAGQKHTATMQFEGSDIKLPGEKVTVENGNLSFSILVQDQDVKVSLKIESNSKMSGKAVYSEGEVPLTLTKIIVEVRQKQ